MNEKTLSNIAVKSNILVIDPETSFKYPHPFYDRKFLQSVENISGLRKFPSWHKAYTQRQKAVIEASRPCDINKERVNGVVNRHGQLWKVTRCSRRAECKFAKTNDCFKETPL